MEPEQWEVKTVAEIGEEAAAELEAEARTRTDAYINGYHLAQERKSLGLTQSELADRMGVTKGRVSQIERGKVSTMNALAAYVEALGGELKVVAVFHDHTQDLRRAS